MQEVGAEHLLRAARDHRLVPADLHARGHGGAALQAARLHQDLRDGLRGRALGDAHAGARGAADPRPDPRRAREPREPLARARLRAGRALRGAPAPARDRRGAARCMASAVPVVPPARQRVHAAAQRGDAALHADRAARDLGRRGLARAPADGPRAEARSPRSSACSARSGAPRRRPIRRRSRWSRRSCTLAPRERWRRGPHLGRARRRSSTRSSAIPGMPNLWWMPIQTRTEMLATGVRSPLGIKVFGDDLAQRRARPRSRSPSALKDVPGTRNAFAERDHRRLLPRRRSIDRDARRRASASRSRT